MKKIFSLLLTLFLFNGCAESVALLGPALGPASTAIGGGNVIRSTATTALNYGIKKQTGMSLTEHTIAYVQENNPKNIKEKCVSFLEASNSEICAAVKNNGLEVKKQIKPSGIQKFIEKNVLKKVLK